MCVCVILSYNHTITLVSSSDGFHTIQDVQEEGKVEPKQEVASFPSHSSSRSIEIQVTGRTPQAEVSPVFAAG